MQYRRSLDLRALFIALAQLVFIVSSHGDSLLHSVSARCTLCSERTISFVFKASEQVLIELILNGVSVNHSSRSNIDDVAEVNRRAARIRLTVSKVRSLMCLR